MMGADERAAVVGAMEGAEGEGEGEVVAAALQDEKSP